MRRMSWSKVGLALLMLAPGCAGGVGGEGSSSAGGSEDTQGTGEEGDGDGDGDGEDAEDPGRITIHRLNNAEYDNTIRDLFFGVVDWDQAEDFPADIHGFGFDNISDVQNLSPLHVELYVRAAELMAAEALRVVPLDTTLYHWEAESEDVGQEIGAASGDFWNLYSNGAVFKSFDEVAGGTYDFSTRVFAQQAGPDLAHFEVVVNEVAVGQFDVPAEAISPETAQSFELEVQLQSGQNSVAVRFTNDYYDPDIPADRNLLVDWIELDGPTDAVPNELRDLIVTCDPGIDGVEPCLEQIIGEFVTRAWRRPLTQAEVADLMALHVTVADLEGDFDDSLEVILTAAMSSPHFLFRPELDDDPTSPTPHPLNDWELASRLSYFLWSSMPDAELFGLAADGSLHEPEVLEEQVDRMLADPRSEALVRNFAGQWLYIRALDDVFKDTATFPEFTDELRESMRGEMEAFFRSFITEARPMRELLTGTTTVVDEQLADIYGLGPVGPGWTEVDLSGLQRSGFITSPGLMAVLSHPETTSPVRRGKWMLDQILCLPPAPPPPDVEIPPPDPDAPETIREQLEAHREDPACAVCHDQIDPLGLAFEHYDPVGRFRTTDKGFTIDASGEMPTDGEPFEDAVGMATLLAEDGEFVRCTARKALIYALGRGIGLSDLYVLDEVEAGFLLADTRLPDLIKLIVTSELFLQRRGEPEDN